MSTEVVGHIGQRVHLEKLFYKDLLPHTLLFAGPAGIGKSCVARELARKIICRGDNNTHLQQVFDAGNCPDFHYRNCNVKDEASTQEIRELLSSLSFMSFGKTARVVILDNVEHLSVQATNALLKMLEEPRSGLHFILIAANKASLLPTIISRCQVWQFSELTPSQIATILERTPEILGARIERKDLPLLTELADGSVANARYIYENLDAIQEFDKKLEELASGSALSAIALAQQLSKDKDHLPQTLSVLATLVRKKMFEHSSQIPGSWGYLLADLLQVKWIVFERNMNANSVLQHVFVTFARLARSPNFAQAYPSLVHQIV